MNNPSLKAGVKKTGTLELGFSPEQFSGLKTLYCKSRIANPDQLEVDVL
jgi:hypothetical protein